jgi:hypothetical protein
VFQETAKIASAQSEVAPSQKSFSKTGLVRDFYSALSTQEFVGWIAVMFFVAHFPYLLFISFSLLLNALIMANHSAFTIYRRKAQARRESRSQNVVMMMLSIQVDEDAVRTLARELAQEVRPWDELVWLFAEAELRLRPALVDGMLYKQGVESRQVDINPSLVEDHPGADAIHDLAKEISHLGPSFQNLHWYIAERRFVYDLAKAVGA